MTAQKRIDWFASATNKQIAEAVATLIMGWRAIKTEWNEFWAEGENERRAGKRTLCGGDDWNPAESIADAWQVHQRMGYRTNPLHLDYRNYLVRIVELRSGPKGEMQFIELDMTPRDICLAALLTVEA
jgi:ABA sandwich protein